MAPVNCQCSKGVCNHIWQSRDMTKINKTKTICKILAFIFQGTQIWPSTHTPFFKAWTAWAQFEKIETSWIFFSLSHESASLIATVSMYLVTKGHETNLLKPPTNLPAPSSRAAATDVELFWSNTAASTKQRVISVRLIWATGASTSTPYHHATYVLS